MDIAEVRRRLRHTIERVRREAAQRRLRLDAAHQTYDRFLDRVAEPVARMFAAALRAEGHPFQISTPAGSVRLTSERSGEDFIELALETDAGEPFVIGRASLTRGRRHVRTERPVREGVSIDALTEEDVLVYLLETIEPFVER